MSEAIDIESVDVAVLKRICAEYEKGNMATLNAAALALDAEMLGRDHEDHSEKD